MRARLALDAFLYDASSPRAILTVMGVDRSSARDGRDTPTRRLGRWTARAVRMRAVASDARVVRATRARALAGTRRVCASATSEPDVGRATGATRRATLIGLGALVSPSRGTRASAKTYKRSIRERFETSISSATRDYFFSFPDDWVEEIVSLNDGKLYGVDTRYKSESGNGQLAVSVLPFVGAEGIKDAGTPEEVLDRFEELIGAYWEQNGFGSPGRAGALKTASLSNKMGVDYYNYELVSPHNLISACIVDDELYLMVASCGARSWKSAEGELRAIVDSFTVPS